MFTSLRMKKRKFGLCYYNDDSLDGGIGGGGAGGSDDGSNGGSQDFAIPEEFADRGWAKNFEGKTGDDLKMELFKGYDNAQSMAGKKASELLTSTDIKQLENFEDIKKALLPQLAPNAIVPEKAEDYSLNDILKDENGNQAFEYPQEIIEHFSGQFQKAGLTKKQGQGLIKMYTDFEAEQFNKLTDADELDKSLNTLFNNNVENKNKCSSLIKEFLSDEDQKFLQDTTPNKQIEIIYKLAKGFAEKYDYKENGSAGQRGSHIQMSQAEKDKEYDRLYDELQKLNSRPHDAKEKQALIDAMVALNR